MTRRPATADVHAAVADWLWVPDSATMIRTDDYLMIRFPDWFEHPLELSRFTPTSDPATLVDEVLERARGLATPALWWWLGLGADPTLDELLTERGGELDETLDVLALGLDGSAPGLVAPDVEIRWQTDLAVAGDSHEVGVEVFGGSMPPEEELSGAADLGAREVASGLGGSLVAYIEGRAAGAGGLSMADGVARLWGGAVREEFRRRGVYTALLAARLAYAVEHGAHLALVKGRVETSGPILRRAGFAAYGQERSYRVPLR